MESLDRTMSNMVAFVQLKTGAVRRHVLDKLREFRHSVVDYGADPTGAQDSTAAFAAARAAAPLGSYYVPSGSYKLTNSDLFSDSLTSGPAVYLNVPGANYDISNALLGRLALRMNPGGTVDFRDSVSGAVLLALSPQSGTIGFFGSAGTTRPTISGNTSDATLRSLLGALELLGLLINNTTYTPPATPPATPT